MLPFDGSQRLQFLIQSKPGCGSGALRKVPQARNVSANVLHSRAPRPRKTRKPGNVLAKARAGFGGGDAGAGPGGPGSCDCVGGQSGGGSSGHLGLGPMLQLCVPQRLAPPPQVWEEADRVWLNVAYMWQLKARLFSFLFQRSKKPTKQPTAPPGPHRRRSNSCCCCCCCCRCCDLKPSLTPIKDSRAGVGSKIGVRTCGPLALKFRVTPILRDGSIFQGLSPCADSSQCHLLGLADFLK